MSDLESRQPCENHCVNVADKEYLKANGYGQAKKDCEGCLKLFRQGLYTKRACDICLDYYQPKVGEDLCRCKECAKLYRKADPMTRKLIDRLCMAITHLYNGLDR